MNTLETLKAARDLISDPARWTQREYARDQFGNSAMATDGYATCWCALGAIRKVTGRENDIYRPAVAQLARHCQVVDIPAGWAVSTHNDTHDHAEVLALFDAAIENLEKELGL